MPLHSAAFLSEDQRAPEKPQMPPPPSSSPVGRPRFVPLMPQPSTAPSRVVEASNVTPPSRRADVKSSPEESKDSRVGFILDSGAPLHGTGCAELLSGPRPTPKETGFRTRAGKVLYVVAVGSIDTPQFVVPEVHQVPELGQGCTIISVRQLARRGLSVTFGCESCDIRERSTGAVVGEGRLREEDGFYYLDYLRILQS